MIALTSTADRDSVVPTRPFGKTGANVSILSLGGMFDIASNQLLMKQAMAWGVTYWDTADCYQRGSERGIGKFLSRQPDAREKLFIVSKSDARDPDGMTRLLDRSLDRMKTDYVDLYFVHGVYRIDELDGRTKAWAEKAKAAGKIRFFGFSTHSNMEDCLLEASRLGWVDGIMMTYNYRLMHSDDMRRAVDACVEAGIGLTAMKTQGGGQVQTDSEIELKLAGRFLQKGFTDAQAKLKAVWQNPQIASICSQMPNMSLLMSNVAAALDKTQLSGGDNALLQRYAQETCSAYCTGCSAICESCVKGEAPIGNVMRYLMYARSYGNHREANDLFKKIPAKIRAQLIHLDYRLAEQNCPQKMPIGKLMQQAVEELS
jgi:predicted aldo/keto reductase-like oxidoreductase